MMQPKLLLWYGCYSWNVGFSSLTIIKRVEWCNNKYSIQQLVHSWDLASLPAARVKHQLLYLPSFRIIPSDQSYLTFNLERPTWTIFSWLRLGMLTRGVLGWRHDTKLVDSMISGLGKASVESDDFSKTSIGWTHVLAMFDDTREPAKHRHISAIFFGVCRPTKGVQGPFEFWHLVIFHEHPTSHLEQSSEPDEPDIFLQITHITYIVLPYLTLFPKILLRFLLTILNSMQS